jgi:hypothetical protein
MLATVVALRGDDDSRSAFAATPYGAYDFAAAGDKIHQDSPPLFAMVAQDDPNGPGLPEWSPFTANNPKAKAHNDSPQMRSVPNPKQPETPDAYFAWRRERAKVC